MSVKYYKDGKWHVFPGTVGAPGKDSYITALENGYEGTVEDYNHACAILPEMTYKVEHADSDPTIGSENLVISNGVAVAISDLKDHVVASDKALSTDITSFKDDYNAYCKENDNTIESLSNVVDDNRTDFDNYVEENNTAVSNLSDTVTKNRDDFDKYVESNDEVLSNLSDTVDDNRTDFDTYVTNNDESVSNISETVTNNRTDFDDYVKSNDKALSDLDDKITDIEESLNGSLDDLEEIVINNKEELKDNINDSIDGLDKSFQEKIDDIIDDLKKKADSSDLENYIQEDTLEDIYDAIDSIPNKIDAEFIADALSTDDPELKKAAAKAVAGVIKGEYLIDGTAIMDGAIVTKHLVANTGAFTVLMAGTALADEIYAGKITADYIKANTITADNIASHTITAKEITSDPLDGLTIQSTKDSKTKWKLNSDGSGELASGNITWDTKGYGSIAGGKITWDDKGFRFGEGVSIAWSKAQSDQVKAVEDNSKKYTDAAKTELLDSIDGKVDSKYTEKIGSKLTYIDENGIYTGTLVADQMVAIDIDASQIKTGTIDAKRLNLKDYLTIGAADSKYATASAVSTLESSVGNKATLSDIIDALSKAPSGTTTINGGWIDTNAITVRSSKIVDDKNNPVTIITSDTLATTKVFAENLQVKAANIDGTLSADKITGTINGLTIQSGTAWILNRDGSGHVANGKLTWDKDGDLSGIGAFTGASYTLSDFQDLGQNTETNLTDIRVHRVGLFNTSYSGMYTFTDGYATPKYVSIMIPTLYEKTVKDSHTGASSTIKLTNNIYIENNLTYNGTKQNLKPYEYKIINTGDAPLNIYKKDSSGNSRSIGVIPVNSYTNIFVYTDKNKEIQCYFQS